jgi:hypothetical protein
MGRITRAHCGATRREKGKGGEEVWQTDGNVEKGTGL